MKKRKIKKNIKDNFRVNLMHFSRVQQCLFVSYFFFGARPTFSISFRSHQVRRTERSEICKFASNLRCETIFQSDKNFRDSNFRRNAMCLSCWKSDGFKRADGLNTSLMVFKELLVVSQSIRFIPFAVVHLPICCSR